MTLPPRLQLRADAAPTVLLPQQGEQAPEIRPQGGDTQPGPPRDQPGTREDPQQPDQQPRGNPCGDSSMIWMLVLLFGFMYFFMIRPQQKQQREHRQLLESLKKGDDVVTQAGIHGTIESLAEHTVVLRVDTIHMTVDRQTIVRVTNREPAASQGPKA